MKKVIKKSLLIALVYYTTILVGCIKNQCNCPIPKTGKFKYTEITSYNLNYSFTGDQTFSTAIVSSDTILKNEFGIRFQFHFKTAYQQQRRINGFSLINTAYACSCVEDNFTSSDTVKSIFIRTLLDFDAAHLAGTDISDYFFNVYQSYSPNGIEYEHAFSKSFNDFNQQYTNTGRKEFDLYLKNTSTANKEVAFELVVAYTNGTSISVKTKPVYLK